MGIIRGVARLLLTFVIILLSIPVFAVATLLPRRSSGILPAAWVVSWLCRAFVTVYRIELIVEGRDRLLTHHGFVFPNHDSYIDVAIPLSLMPVRFISRIENRSMPFIGWLAENIDTVFVDRQDKSSREAARDALSNTALFPPMMVYPEGGIDRDPGIAEFRYGAFEIAVQNEIPFIPTVIVYEEFEVAAWLDESLTSAVWRLAQHKRTRCRVVFLPVVSPSADTVPADLAKSTHAAMVDTMAQARDAFNRPSD